METFELPEVLVKFPTWKVGNFSNLICSSSSSSFVLFLFSKGRKVKLLGHLWINHPEIWWASPINDYLQVLLKRLFSPTTRGSSRTTSRWRTTENILVKNIWITIFKIFAIVIIALPISGLLFPKNPTWKLSNFLKFLFSFFKFPNWKFGNFYNSFFPSPSPFPKVEKLKFLSYLWINHPEIWWASSINDYLQVL